VYLDDWFEKYNKVIFSGCEKMCSENILQIFKDAVIFKFPEPFIKEYEKISEGDLQKRNESFLTRMGVEKDDNLHTFDFSDVETLLKYFKSSYSQKGGFNDVNIVPVTDVNSPPYDKIIIEYGYECMLFWKHSTEVMWDYKTRMSKIYKIPQNVCDMLIDFLPEKYTPSVETWKIIIFPYTDKDNPISLNVPNPIPIQFYKKNVTPDFSGVYIHETMSQIKEVRAMTNNLSAEKRAAINFYMETVVILFLKLCELLNNKDIQKIKYDPPEKVQKKRQSEGKHPLFSYFNLNLGSVLK